MAGMSMVQELEGLRLASKTYKSESEAMARVNVELKERLAVVEQSAIAAVEAHNAELAKVSEALVKAQEDQAVSIAKVAELEGKMQLVPVVDATAGQAPIADGGAAPEPKVEVDFYAEWKKLDGVEAAEYYKAHQKEMDEQFK